MTAAAQIDWIASLPDARQWIYCADRDRDAVLARCKQIYDAIQILGYHGMVTKAKLCRIANIPRTDLEMLLQRMESAGYMLYEDGRGWVGQFGIKEAEDE